jgi:hypothetical protein
MSLLKIQTWSHYFILVLLVLKCSQLNWVLLIYIAISFPDWVQSLSRYLLVMSCGNFGSFPNCKLMHLLTLIDHSFSLSALAVTRFVLDKVWTTIQINILIGIETFLILLLSLKATAQLNRISTKLHLRLYLLTMSDNYFFLMLLFEGKLSFPKP